MDCSTMDPAVGLYWLGELVDDTYEPADDCSDVLDEIIQDLSKENVHTKEIRCKILAEKTLENDLIPLLKCCQEPTIFDKCIRLLVSFTQPQELTPSPDAALISSQLAQLTKLVKHLGTDITLLKVLQQRMDTLLSQDSLDEVGVEVMNLCVLFMRNIFHLLPTASPQSESAILHQRLLSSFFINEMDHIILALLNHKQKEMWTVGLTQLISFIFKHYSSSLLEPDIDDNSYSNSSSGNSSPVCEVKQSSNQNLTENFEDKLQLQSRKSSSEADSSEEDYMIEFAIRQDGKLELKVTNCPIPKNGSIESGSMVKSSIDRISGNAEDMEVGDTLAKESNSGSRDSLSKDSLNNEVEEINLENVHPASTLMDLDILVSYLKKFATSIMNSGFVNLVENIMRCLLSEYSHVLDHSFLMWTVGFFLNFSHQQDLDFNCYKDILNLDLFGYLIYEGVVCCEIFQAKIKQMVDTSVEKNRLHILICTLNQMFRALINNRAMESLNIILKPLGQLSQLRNLFVLMLSNFSSSVQTPVYLRDIVQTNHLMMLLLEDWMSLEFIGKHTDFDMVEHVKQFATKDIMAKYGSLLDSPDVNMDGLMIAVMSIMYHVAGDCDRRDTLLQPQLIVTFYNLWADNALKDFDQLRDLVEVIMEMFISSMEKDPKACINGLMKCDSNTSLESLDKQDEVEMDRTLNDNKIEELSEEERGLIFSWVSDLPDENICEYVKDGLRKHGFSRTQQQVEHFLFQYGFIQTTAQNCPEENNEDSLYSRLIGLKQDEVVPYLVECLKEKGFTNQLSWLQKQLLEAAYVKITIRDPSNRKRPEEPVQKFFAIQNKAIPLVPWNEDLALALDDPTFLLLLCNLGILTREEGSCMYSRIPPYMTPEALVEKAECLDLIDPVSVKFDLSCLKHSPDFGDMAGMEEACNFDQPCYVPKAKPIKQTNWLDFVQKKNLKAK